MDNMFNLNFDESNNCFCNKCVPLYKKIIFFIQKILDRLITLTFQYKTTSKQTNACNDHKNIGLGFFKKNKQSSMATNLETGYPRDPTLYK